MISVLFKTITQQSFTVDVEETATIGEVKQKIEDTKGKEAFPVGSQKLIFNGKVLEDAMTISELNITAPKFIVIMVMRKAAPPSSTGAPATSAATAKGAGGQPSAGVKSAEDKAVAKQDGSTSATSADKSKSAAPSADVPPEHAQTVANIEAMGYPRQEVVRALQAAFFDAERAVEYLCNGIPEGLSLQRANSGEEVGPPNEDEEELVQVPLDDPEGLAFLAQSPQFQQLRDMLRADPTMLPQIVQQIAATNPQLMELIRTNQAQFLQMLNDGQPLGEAGGDAVAAGDGGAAVGVGAPVAPQGQPRRINIPVTPQDREAIARLVGMGFPETLVIEAYFACDKNEDLAVNYILARLDEFHNELAGGDQGGQ
ncbi:UV excision repair protein rad23 [Globodera pallida]|nr:UV excision repair protein rad23 [Globodera pallida]